MYFPTLVFRSLGLFRIQLKSVVKENPATTEHKTSLQLVKMKRTSLRGSEVSNSTVEYHTTFPSA